MSIRSQKRKLKDDSRQKKAFELYWQLYRRWEAREPSRWHIFAWLKWKSACPKKPKGADEYAELYDKHWVNRRRRIGPWY